MKPYILIVDDEFGLADAVADMLEERGFETKVVINGKLALAALEIRVADLVLTDLMMPVMDGPELIAAVRADSRFADVPVVMMTALPEAVPSAAGHNALLVKPFRIADLIQTIRSLLPE
jgi:CheY-like chemotaxis protein